MYIRNIDNNIAYVLSPSRFFTLSLNMDLYISFLKSANLNIGDKALPKPHELNIHPLPILVRQ